MSAFTKLKTIDGIDIYFNAENARFVAMIGCTCALDEEDEPWPHLNYCRGRAIGRNNLKDVEKEITKQAPVEPATVDAILLSGYSEPYVAKVMSIERSRGRDRVRGASHGLYADYTRAYVYTEEAFRELHELYEAYRAAQSALQEATGKLEALTPARMRELQREASAQ